MSEYYGWFGVKEGKVDPSSTCEDRFVLCMLMIRTTGQRKKTFNITKTYFLKN